MVRRRIKEFLIYRVLGLKDTPHRIALGLAVAIFITWTPSIPFQMILTVTLSALLGANKIVGLPFVWISNPLTAVPLYGFNFYIGCLILPGDCSFSKFNVSIQKVFNSEAALMTRLDSLWDLTVEFFGPLWVGSILIGMILAIFSYVIAIRSIIFYRKHYKHKLAARGL